MIVTVGVEDDRTLIKLGFQTIGIELCLLLFFSRVTFGAFGFD
jgi:hypothetical protein